MSFDKNDVEWRLGTPRLTIIPTHSEYSLPGCGALYSGRQETTFQNQLLPPSIG